MQARSAHTRHKLVVAGAQTFGREGYASATMEQIARGAGVTKGALYFHFASKSDLADAVQEQACAALRGHLDAQRRTERAPVQQLIDLTYWLARSLHQDPLIRAGCRLAAECVSPPAGVPGLRQAWIREVVLLLGRARQAGSLHPGAVQDGPEALLSAAVCGLESLAGTGLELPQLLGRVAALWAVLLPTLVPAGDLGRYHRQAPPAVAR